MITELQGLEETLKDCVELVKAKNGDYNASWRRMRFEGISDVIANKIDRIRNMEDMAREGRSPAVSEGIDSELVDIINYCTFYRIKMWERDGVQIAEEETETKAPDPSSTFYPHYQSYQTVLRDYPSNIT